MGVANCSVNGTDEVKMEIKCSLLLKNKYLPPQILPTIWNGTGDSTFSHHPNRLTHTSPTITT